MKTKEEIEARMMKSSGLKQFLYMVFLATFMPTPRMSWNDPKVNKMYADAYSVAARRNDDNSD